MVLVVATKKVIIYKALVWPPYVFLCLSNILKIFDIVILDLPDIFLSIDFKTIF